MNCTSPSFSSLTTYVGANNSRGFPKLELNQSTFFWADEREDVEIWLSTYHSDVFVVVVDIKRIIGGV